MVYNVPVIEFIRLSVQWNSGYRIMNLEKKKKIRIANNQFTGNVNCHLLIFEH